MTDDRAKSLILLAKQPEPGRVKTRLQARFSPVEAAELAAAALADTVDSVRSSRARHRFLAFDGDPTGWDDGFTVLRQPEGGLSDRLAAAFRDAMVQVPDEPVLLIGMDTPQVSVDLLDRSWRGSDAVLGLSEDGGFWAIGLRSVDPEAVFAGIPMSTDRTGAAQLARLGTLGLSVELLPPLRDIDEPADADHVADRFPLLRFSQRHRQLTAANSEQPVERLFDQLYDGGRVVSLSGGGRRRGEGFVDGYPRWARSADPVDEMVVLRCEAPVIDIGCGPGRMVAALQQSGRAALGIDISRTAVALGSRRGGQLLRRGYADPLPGEGRWGTALLLDGNIGLGGDAVSLIGRCRELVGAGGLIICELDPDPASEETYQLVLSDQRHHSAPTPWVSIGLGGIQRIAARLDLIIVEEWRAGDRAFVSLRTAA
jgi:rSAM/selenodomain-associated transferase 1